MSWYGSSVVSFAFIYDRWNKYELKPSFLPLAFGVQFFFLNTDTQILLLGIKKMLRWLVSTF